MAECSKAQLKNVGVIRETVTELSESSGVRLEESIFAHQKRVIFNYTEWNLKGNLLSILFVPIGPITLRACVKKFLKKIVSTR
jgi:hypothetical protein